MMNEKIKELIEISKNNPDLEILTKVDNDLHSDDFGWNLGIIGKIEINEYWCPCERIYLDDEIYDELADSFSNEPESEGLSDLEFKEVIELEIEKKRKSKEIDKAIFVEITV